MTELDDVLAYLAKELLGWEKPHPDTRKWIVGGEHVVYLRDMLTGNGMLEIIEAMRERGYRITLYFRGDVPTASVDGDTATVQKNGKAMTEAVARAAYAALQTT